MRFAPALRLAATLDFALARTGGSKGNVKLRFDGAYSKTCG
jgi:hypothetical protein